MSNFLDFYSLINKHSSFIITTHVNPDADAIGSELAIAGILKQLNKKYKIVNTSKTPYNLKFLDKQNEIEYYDESIHDNFSDQFEVAIFLDLNWLNRTVRLEKEFRKFSGLKVCIDHHTYPEGFGDLEIIDDSKSSTGEIIYDLIKDNKQISLNENIALSLYAAIMTDTGSFRYSKTNSNLHKKVAEILKFNLDPEIIYDQIYGQFKFSRIKLLGEALQSISLSDSGKTSYMIVTQDSLKRLSAEESDVDGFVNFALTTIGVKIGILFFELKDGCKISFRSKGNIEVNKLAKKFGGGGHRNAAGTRLFNVNLNEIITEVLKEADKILEE